VTKRNNQSITFHVIRSLLSWMIAFVVVASPVAALATAPCPMAASGQAMMMDEDHGSPMQNGCDHKAAKACIDLCSAMAAAPATTPVMISIEAPLFSTARLRLLPSPTLVARSPGEPVRPPRLIA
jgi:hypothetical protein